MPSPVQMSALVVGLKHWPAPPEAWITALAANSSIAPSRMLRQIAPQQVPSSSWTSDGDEPLLVAVDLLVVLHQLLVEHVQQRLAGDVGDVVRARGGGAAERPRAEMTGLAAVERDARVLQPQHLAGRLPAHDLDRVLVAEVIRALHGVVGVRLPRIVRVQRRVDPAGGGVGVRSDGMDLGHDRHRRALAGRCQGGSLTGEAGADDQDVVCGHGAQGYYAAYTVDAAVPVRLMIVDDHADVRYLIRAIVEDARRSAGRRRRGRGGRCAGGAGVDRPGRSRRRRARRPDAGGRRAGGRADDPGAPSRAGDPDVQRVRGRRPAREGGRRGNRRCACPRTTSRRSRELGGGLARSTPG